MTLHEEIDNHLHQMRESVQQVLKSERIYRGIVAGYADKYGPGITADYKAADDIRLRTAIGDGAYYRDRAQTFALGAIALMLHEQRAKSGGQQ